MSHEQTRFAWVIPWVRCPSGHLGLSNIHATSDTPIKTHNLHKCISVFYCFICLLCYVFTFWQATLRNVDVLWRARLVATPNAHLYRRKRPRQRLVVWEINPYYQYLPISYLSICRRKRRISDWECHRVWCMRMDIVHCKCWFSKDRIYGTG